MDVIAGVGTRLYSDCLILLLLFISLLKYSSFFKTFLESLSEAGVGNIRPAGPGWPAEVVRSGSAKATTGGTGNSLDL